jgi:hypothetical protein
VLAVPPWLSCREKEWAQLLRSFAADAYNCIMVRIQQDPPHTRMWRDDLKITANRSGLRLVSYYVPGASIGRRRLTRGVDRRRPMACPPPPCKRTEKRKEVRTMF